METEIKQEVNDVKPGCIVVHLSVLFQSVPCPAVHDVEQHMRHQAMSAADSAEHPDITYYIYY